MAVSYSAKKCDSCGGSLEYIKEKKVWRCRYCGQEIVREEQYDGLFTIKNVARQSVLDTAYRRMDQANQNLTECEKIDARYIGTLIARICYRLIAVLTPEACRAEELVKMIKTSNARKRSRAARGKKATDADSRYVKLAEDYLYGEVAISLGLGRDQVKAFVRERIGEE